MPQPNVLEAERGNIVSATTPAERPQSPPSFRFDTTNIPWKDFLTDGCYYRILDVNVEAHTADMLVKFDPGARCLFHRHVAATTTLVIGRLAARLRPNRWRCGRENQTGRVIL
jgi:hypothetical protein